MSKLRNEFFRVHKEHRSIFILVWGMLGLELLSLITRFITSLIFIESGEVLTFTYIYFINVFVNFLLSLCIFTNWLCHYYIVTEDGISINTGFLFRRSRTFDFQSIKSIRIRQGILGKIFNYGTIELEIPVIKKMPVLHSVSNAFEFAKILEEQRLKASSTESGHETVSPIKTDLL